MARKKQYLARITDWRDLERLVEKGWRIVALAPEPRLEAHLPVVLVAVYE